MNSTQLALLAAFHAARVEYAVVGGVAVNAHGYVRATSDLDLFIRPTEENAAAVHRALTTLGIPLKGVAPGDFLDDESNVRFGPAEDHVDILASIGGMTFDQVWRNRIVADVHGVAVSFISKTDLIENKRQIGRLRDLADVEELELLPEQQLAVAVMEPERESDQIALPLTTGAAE